MKHLITVALLATWLLFPVRAQADDATAGYIIIDNGTLYYDHEAKLYVILDEDLNRYYPVKFFNGTARKAKHLRNRNVWALGYIVPPSNGWGWGTLYVYYLE